MIRARRLCLWVFTLGSLAVVLGILGQAYTIAAYVRGAGEQARDLHVLGAYVVHTVELVVFLASLGAFPFSWRRALVAFLFPVIGTIQVFAIGDTDAPGGWVNGLHGALATVVLLWASAFACVGYRALWHRR